MDCPSAHCGKYIGISSFLYAESTYIIRLQDDNEICRMGVEMIFKRHNISCQAAMDGQEAYERLTELKEAYQVVLMDR